MALRHASQNDIRAIAEVHVKSWQTTYAGQLPQTYLDHLSVPKREAAWKDALATPSHQLIVTESDGRVNGFASLGPSRDSDAGPAVGEVYAIYLLEPFQGQGIGKSLWSEALKSLKARSFDQLTLWVLDTNSMARRFYERVGLALDGASKRATIGGQEVIELRYRMRL